MKNTKMYAGYRYPPQVISHAVWLCRQQATPLKIVTDKLRSYSAARREIMPSVVHSTQQYENNRCELSHQPGRQQEPQIRRFKSQGQAQRFLTCHGIVNNLFRLGRHKMQADNYRILRERAFS
jgi:putative transposase